MDIKLRIEIAERQMLEYLGIDLNSNHKLICSPFREDKTPSFSVFKGRDSKLRYYDFGTNEYGDSLDFMKRIGIQLNTESAISDKESKASVKKEVKTLITLKPRTFSIKDVEYWTSYGASIEMLTTLVSAGELTAVAEYNLFKAGVFNFNKKCDEYAYALTSKDFRSYKPAEQMPFKLYQPYSKKHKWISKMSCKEWFFWNRIPCYGTHIIITSSFKDALCLWSQLDIPSVAPQGEGMELQEDKMNDLQRRFDNIWLIYDSDKAGRIFAERNCKKYDYVRNIELPSMSNAKDISDIFKKIGDENEFREFMGYLI